MEVKPKWQEIEPTVNDAVKVLLDLTLEAEGTGRTLLQGLPAGVQGYHIALFCARRWRGAFSLRRINDTQGESVGARGLCVVKIGCVKPQIGPRQAKAVECGKETQLTREASP